MRNCVKNYNNIFRENIPVFKDGTFFQKKIDKHIFYVYNSNVPRKAERKEYGALVKWSRR